jgi:hypothetical protein
MMFNMDRRGCSVWSHIFLLISYTSEGHFLKFMFYENVWFLNVCIAYSTIGTNNISDDDHTADDSGGNIKCAPLKAWPKLCYRTSLWCPLDFPILRPRKEEPSLVASAWTECRRPEGAVGEYQVGRVWEAPSSISSTGSCFLGLSIDSRFAACIRKKQLSKILPKYGLVWSVLVSCKLVVKLTCSITSKYQYNAESHADSFGKWRKGLEIFTVYMIQFVKTSLSSDASTRVHVNPFGNCNILLKLA